jgi:putative DNA methylase
MIPKECKRLAEVDFPIAVVSKHAAREKSGPPGYPSRLHIWWAHRPLGACRAILLGLLLPDPCDENCPALFNAGARRLLSRMFSNISESNIALRHALLRFIGDFADWSVAGNQTYLEIARGLVRLANDDETPLVADPFAGRGSIPMEALRLGCEAYGSDLNPVAVFILKILLEYIPRHGHDLSDELERVGRSISIAARDRLSHIYPADANGDRPIAFLWSRTVRCESPDCGAEIPIYKSPWLSKRGATRAKHFREDERGTCVALLIADAPRGGPVRFRIARGIGSEDSKTGFIAIHGTKAAGNNANVVCPCCKSVLPGNKKNPRVPSQLAAQRGGADVVFNNEGERTGGAYLLAVVTRRSGQSGQQYRLPVQSDYKVVFSAATRLRELVQATTGETTPIPDEYLPPAGTLGFRVQRYGMQQWADLFTVRQQLSLLHLMNLIRDSNTSPEVRALLAAAFSRVLMSNMSCTRWNAVSEKMQHTFGRQALPIVWDFAEIVPIADAPGNWDSGYQLVAEVIDKWPGGSVVGQVDVCDAKEHPLPPESVDVLFTDPPYYDAVPYSDLSDFFFVWLKRVLPSNALLRDPYDPSNPLTPKGREIVQDETRSVDGHPKDHKFFEEMMSAAFAQGRLLLKQDGVGCVVFAHKTTEGWEALLSGMIRGGWTITGSWPISTEMGSRLRAMESAALATSVHLICRPRDSEAVVGDWGDVLRELPVKVSEWIARLQSEGIRGGDLVFACIGPALEIFSRYPRVETAQGDEVRLNVYLEKVWEIVGRVALEQILGTAEGRARNGAAGALEEDARLTALFLWTIQATAAAPIDPQSNEENTDYDVEEESEDDEDDDGPPGRSKGFSLIYDVVRRFAQPLGIHLDEWEGRIIRTEKGVVRLIPVSERSTQLFGEDGASLAADRIERTPSGPIQLTLFPTAAEASPPPVRGRRRRPAMAVSEQALQTQRSATTLDRVHAAILLQASGRSNALRALLKDEVDRGPDFVRLANALSALYPADSDEKRLVDAMLLGVPK